MGLPPRMTSTCSEGEEGEDDERELERNWKTQRKMMLTRRFARAAGRAFPWAPHRGLTSQQVAQFERDGFLVLPRDMPAATVGALKVCPLPSV
jgi:hypothetical protein